DDICPVFKKVRVCRSMVAVMISVNQDSDRLVSYFLRLRQQRFVAAGSFAIDDDQPVRTQAETRIASSTGDQEQTGLHHLYPARILFGVHAIEVNTSRR